MPRYIIMSHRSAESSFGEAHRPVQELNGEILTFATRRGAQVEAAAYNEGRVSPHISYTVEEQPPAEQHARVL